MSMYNDSLDVEAFDDVMSFLVRVRRCPPRAFCLAACTDLTLASQRHNPRHALRSYELCRIAYLVRPGALDRPRPNQAHEPRAFRTSTSRPKPSLASASPFSLFTCVLVPLYR